MIDQRESTRGEHRALLAARLVEWLDQVLDESEPPTGLAAEVLEMLDRNDGDFVDGKEAADWYEVQAALTALTQEIRLQSRTFARMTEKLDETTAAGDPAAGKASLPALLEAVGTVQATVDSLNRRNRREADSPLPEHAVALLLDLRDRLLQAENAAMDSLDAAEATLPKWWPVRLLVGRSVRAVLDGYRELLKGYVIAIERLDDTLAEHEIIEVGHVGDAFDPRVMKIVDIEDCDDRAEGTVLDIYRRGYLRRGIPLRPAEVKVARAVTGRDHERRKP